LNLNTKAVAELLETSTSTVQRWVKQLNLEMERNELGHFIFSKEDVEILKEVKQQLQNGILLQDISISKNKRSGVLKTVFPESNLDQLAEKVNQMEISLNQKADSVVTYQLLQHRREIEELLEQVSLLTDRVAQLEELLPQQMEIAATGEIHMKTEKKSPRKKKNLLQVIFGS
jgi:chromosome-anchoring protein RacA